MNLRWLLLAVPPLASLLAGCVQPPPEPRTAVALEQLLAEHNAPASRIDKLWANASISVWLNAEGRNVAWTFSSGTLLMGKGPDKLGPHYFVLMAREAGTPVFQLGSNLDQNVYYFWARYGDRGQLWRGRLDLAGAPGVDIPVDPTQVPAVLGVLELPSDLTRIPTVALTMQPPSPVLRGPWVVDYTPYAYALTYIDRQPVSNKIMFKREILVRRSDAEPRLPYQINFIDPQGRRVMIASLRNYKPIDMGPDADKSQAAVLMPTDIDIAWPAKNSRLRIVLSDMTTTKGDPVEGSRFDPPAGLPETRVDEFVAAPAAVGGAK